MTEFDRLRIVTGYEFLKHIRRKRLYVILGIALLADVAVLILIPLLGETGGYPESVNLMAAMLAFGSSLAALGAVFFAGDAIAGEFESKTGYILFTNPVKRLTLVVGKYLACLIAVILLIIFTYIVSTVSLLAIYQEVPFETLTSFGLCLLFAAAVLSVTFFFSAVSKGSMGATIMTLLFIWVICGIVETVLGFTGNPYWYVLSAGGDSIAMAYGGLESFMAGFGGGDMGAMMAGFEPLTSDMAAWGMTIYLVLGLGLSLWISNRRQLA